MKITVKGSSFECGRSCETILMKGDEAVIVDGQVICTDCAAKELKDDPWEDKDDQSTP